MEDHNLDLNNEANLSRQGQELRVTIYDDDGCLVRYIFLCLFIVFAMQIRSDGWN